MQPQVRSISIHALAKRATVARKILPSDKRLFQSTPSQRGRQTSTAVNKDCVMISIHALAKRATLTGSRKQRNFTKFQSTPSQRGRPCTVRWYHKGSSNFNPRPRKEGDQFKSKTGGTVNISIHALAKRATA